MATVDAQAQPPAIPFVSGLYPHWPQQKSRQVGEGVVVALGRLRLSRPAFALDRLALLARARLVDAGDRCGWLLAPRAVVAAMPAAAGLVRLGRRVPLGRGARGVGGGGRLAHPGNVLADELFDRG